MTDRNVHNSANTTTEASDSKDVLEKYDRESAVRHDLGKWFWVTAIIGISLTIFHLYTAMQGPYTSLIQGAIHLGSGMALIFVLYPIKRNMTSRAGVPWYDAILAMAALYCNFYIVWNYDALSNAIVQGYTAQDTFVATLAVLLLLEATRRAVGIPIVIIAAIAILYGVYGNAAMFGVFSHGGFEWGDMMRRLFYRTEAIFGTPIQISSTYIFLFLFFGVMLVQTNIGKFFNDLAFGLTGRFTGGTAKAAVSASALQGTITGSSVANTVSSGSFTIPMMKRAGFKPEFTAAAEASASTGGQIMPPIMGAAAFIMADYTGVPYSEIIIIALIPAFLYFSGVFMGTHFQAKKQGIHGLPKSELPSLKSIGKRLDLLAPLVVIIGLLLNGFTPTYAALYGILTSFIVSLFREDTRMNIPKMIVTLEKAARTALPVIAACASAGIIVGIVTTTGLGGQIAGGILQLAGGNFFLIMFFTMLACILLGMGLPTTANYVVTASMAAPALIEYGVPDVAAHMFVFYFGIVADITPPVCLAAYAGAGIARANPLSAGVSAFKLAIAAFIVPYAFVYNPVLVLQGDANFMSVSIAVATALIGMAGVSAAMMNYFFAAPNMIERLLLFTGGLMAIYPATIDDPGSIAITVGGIALLAVIALLQVLRNKRNKTEPAA
ncbi:TRAP transporter 4TM/12TM fusion protein [Salsuginibacillus halophilus]|uniref:TRAP transporter 4TM/12TM fusion protein n=1 Tax=Salsuginibacillus halophilus TaxID=517424 RepID=A0A2P8HXM3_9BACI|nr:TRAP transporter permease [Salsuginibacillus halophilus]PSL50957.1 TRAP transporter 4TM/12TM fusion protein [Salsuginibacillus halophilus]